MKKPSYIKPNTFFGFSTSKPNSLNNHINKINTFFKGDCANFLVLGDFDILTISALPDNFDLLSRNFSSFFINRSDLTSDNENFQTYTNWGTLLYNNNNFLDENLIGIIKMKSTNNVKITNHKAQIVSLYETFDNINSLAIFESRDWDNVKLIVSSNSFQEIFRFTRKLHSIFKEHIVENIHTETLFGLNCNCEAFLTSDSWQLNKRDKIGLSISCSTSPGFKFESLINQDFKKIFQIYRTAGKTDFVLYPIKKNNFLLSSNQAINRLTTLLRFIDKNNLNLSVSTTIYSKFKIESIYEECLLPNSKGINFEDLNSLYDLLKKIKVPTPIRSSIAFLLSNFNQYVLDPTICESVEELKQPLSVFISNLRKYDSQQNDNKNYTDILYYVKSFTLSFEHALENRLHNSQKFENMNHIFISTKWGMTSLLESFSKMSLLLSKTLNIDGFFMYFTYNTDPEINSQSFNLNYYSLLNPEKFCSLIGAELFHLYCNSFSNRESLFYKFYAESHYFIDNVKGDFFYKPSIVVFNKQTDYLELMNDSFIQHVYIDLFNYIYMFKGNEKLYSFWYWSMFLMTPLSYNANGDFVQKSLKIRMLRFSLVLKLMEIFKYKANNNLKNTTYKAEYPGDFQILKLEFRKHKDQINKFSNFVLKVSAIQPWIDELYEYIYNFSGEEDSELAFVKYRAKINDFLNKLMYLYHDDKMHFSYSGKLVVDNDDCSTNEDNCDITQSKLKARVEYTRKRFLEEILLLNNN